MLLFDYKIPVEADRALRDAYVALAFAFRRLEGSARSRDTELCSTLLKVRAEIERVLKAQDAAPAEALAAPSASQEALREALVDAAAHLRGAASAYREHAARHRSVGRAKPDPFFTTRADDFDKAADRVSAALAQSAPVKAEKEHTR